MTRAVRGVVAATVSIAAACSGTVDDAAPSTSDPLALPTPSPSPTSTELPDTDGTTTLANGLEVVITPVADASTTAVVLVFGVGSNHDPPGRSGLAHFAEHLLVTGATSREPARTVDSLVADYPLGWNAQTGTDFTILATVVDPADLAGELELVASRLAGVDLTADDVAREQARILLEVDNMFGGIPSLAVSNLARERLLPTPNLGRRGGDPEALASLTLDELDDWLGFYHPGNATLSIAGPGDPRTTLDLVDQIFTPIPDGPAPPAAAPQLPGPSGVTVATGAAGTEGLVALAYAAPRAVDGNYPAFLIAAGRLFVEGPALGLSTSFAPIDDPAALTITGPTLSGETPDEAGARLKSDIDDLVTGRLGGAEATQTAQFFGPLLGFDVNANTYGVALSAARTPMLDVDPDAIERDLALIDDEAYQAVVRNLVVDAPVAGAVVTG